MRQEPSNQPGPAPQPALAVCLPGQRAAVVGLGISNLAVIRFLLRRGALVTAMDAKTPEQLGDRYRQLSSLAEEAGVDSGRLELRLGSGYLDGLARFPIAFLAPGLPKSLPLVQAAQEAGTILSSEVHLVFELCRAPILGITGSAGKTTTTSLAGEIMKATGRPTFVGGNIGTPLVETVESIPPGGQVVLELSSFQLQLLSQSPPIGVVLNVSPNHLDVHASMAEYIEAKKNIFRFQRPDDLTVLNADRPETRAMAAECPGRVVWFSRLGEVERGAFVKGREIVVRGEEGDRAVAEVGQIKILGLHNLENVLAAVAATSLTGARPEEAAKAIIAFPGVVHRLELVRELDGVRYINDSIATAPDRTLAALHTLGAGEGQPARLLLIAGGYDKHLPFDQLAEAMLGKVRILLLLGQTADLIEQAVRRAAAKHGGQGGPAIVRGHSLDEMVTRGSEMARDGDVVLLSPACASYDMYRNFEERGEHFRRLVSQLGGRR
ncbi:MAG: UDP-N-acetylmuramoyl-L-alanine--D-glutamate ligase [Firmicutes bacterium]|nr:UDP-N-acetylmuramoyl-L-alanine--D-glutamate ligase [Bacillota bacterium]